MPGAKLSKAASIALHSVIKERRLMEFSKSARVDRRTVGKMAKGGYVEIALVRKVEAVLAARNGGSKPTIEIVEVIVCASYGISRETLHTSSTPIIIEAKQICCLLAKTECNMKATEIARHFGYSDHTGPGDAIKKIKGRIEVNPQLNSLVNRITSKVLSAP